MKRDGSMLTWESNQILGVNSILEKLESLPFQKVAHKTDTIDAQPSSATVASLLVLVTGQLMVDDSPNPIPFSQVFQLMPENGSYYVQNDVFRWVLRSVNCIQAKSYTALSTDKIIHDNNSNHIHTSSL